jgi:hypothetical protein
MFDEGTASDGFAADELGVILSQIQNQHIFILIFFSVSPFPCFPKVFVNINKMPLGKVGNLGNWEKD